jgi:chromosome segregation ATPase
MSSGDECDALRQELADLADKFNRADQPQLDQESARQEAIDRRAAMDAQKSEADGELARLAAQEVELNRQVDQVQAQMTQIHDKVVNWDQEMTTLSQELDKPEVRGSPETYQTYLARFTQAQEFRDEGQRAFNALDPRAVAFSNQLTKVWSAMEGPRARAASLAREQERLSREVVAATQRATATSDQRSSLLRDMQRVQERLTDCLERSRPSGGGAASGGIEQASANEMDGGLMAGTGTGEPPQSESADKSPDE